MKKTNVFRGVLMLLVVSILVSPMNLNARDEEPGSQAGQSQSLSPFDAGIDLVSSYLWRGTKFGVGPAMQPSINFTFGGLTIGGWGNYNFTSDEGAEADLYFELEYTTKYFGIHVGAGDGWHTVEDVVAGISF